MDFKGVEITWLGHAAMQFRFGGTTVLVDPFLEGNPKCPDDFETPSEIDAIYLTHGHFDHMGDTVALHQATGADVFCNHEISVYLDSVGVTATGANFGGTITGPGGLEATLVPAMHSSGISTDDGIVDGGAAGGWVFHFPSELKLYHAGDTTIFSDMKLIAELYRPDVAALPIGGHYTMGPQEAALAAGFLDVKAVIPIHFDTFPILTGSPRSLRGALGGTDVEVVELQPGVAVGG